MGKCKGGSALVRETPPPAPPPHRSVLVARQGFLPPPSVRSSCAPLGAAPWRGGGGGRNNLPSSAQLPSPRESPHRSLRRQEKAPPALEFRLLRVTREGADPRLRLQETLRSQPVLCGAGGGGSHRSAGLGLQRRPPAWPAGSGSPRASTPCGDTTNRRGPGSARNAGGGLRGTGPGRTRAPRPGLRGASRDRTGRGTVPEPRAQTAERGGAPPGRLGAEPGKSALGQEQTPPPPGVTGGREPPSQFPAHRGPWTPPLPRPRASRGP